MRRSFSMIALFLVTSASAQQATSSRAGPRALLDRFQEISLARSAAPETISQHARVLAFTERGYVIADSGTSTVTCVVNRSWAQSIEPHCYDAEASATVLPIELFRNEQRHAGRAEAEIEREIQARLASGKFRPPTRPALTYMMSAAQVLYDDSGKRVGAWRPHVMLYYPYLTNSALALPSQPEMRVGMVSAESTPFATLVLIMPQFVELTSQTKK